MTVLETKTIVIAVSAEKGGTGKTTTACNLAAGLALKEKYAGGGDVVLVDVDPQGDSAKFWGVHSRVYHEERNPDGPCISAVLLGETEVGNALIPLRENLYLLPASARLKDAEFELFCCRGRRRGCSSPPPHGRRPTRAI